MFTKIAFAAVAAVIAATIVAAAPVLAGQSTGKVIAGAENIAAQGWCSGPREHTDFRCS
jgi:hypothetical protein